MARARYAGEQQREGAMQLTIVQMEQLTTRETVLDGMGWRGRQRMSVYSGCVETGKDLWVIGPKYDPAVTALTVWREARSLPTATSPGPQ